MRGLDNYIEGRYDLNNPANQYDWAEDFGCVLDLCEWCTDEMLDDDDTYEKLGELMLKVANELNYSDCFGQREKYRLISDNAELLAARFEEEYIKSLKK